VEREALIERAKLIQRAKALKAQQSSPSEPPIEAIGNTSGPTAAAKEKADKSLVTRAVETVGEGMGAAAKALDVPRALTTAPLLGLGLEALTGKDVVKLNEYLNAANPTNLETMPTANEMYERAGVPEGAKISDFIDMAPKDSPWYAPEKGGMLDFTVRGAGGLGTDIAIDPLTYLSMGAASAGKKGLQNASREIAKELAQKNAGPISRATRPLREGAQSAFDMLTALPRAAAEKVAEIPKVGPAVIGAAQAPSKAVGWAGKKLYSSALLPVEFEGAKYGKGEVGQTLFDLGIANPLTLTSKADEATDALMNARNKILRTPLKLVQRYQCLRLRNQR